MELIKYLPPQLAVVYNGLGSACQNKQEISAVSY